MFDVAIVGAGLAGLAAAHALSDLDIVVLEQSQCAGGRIQTRSQMGIQYDLGAVLAYEAGLFPADLNASPIMRSDAPAGIFYQGRMHTGRDVRSCLQALGAPATELALLDRFRNDPARDARTLPPHLYEILNATFRDIHFGELGDYLPARQRDALRFSTPGYRRGGNGEATAYYAAQLGERLRLQTAVTTVVDLGHVVRLATDKEGQRATIDACAAIVATPAFVTRRLLATMDGACRAFLESVRYAGGSVVALGLQGVELPEFSYLVTPQLACNTVLRRRHAAQQIELLLVYYAGAAGAALRQRSDTEAVGRALAALRRLGVGEIGAQNVVFSDVQHWPAVGVVIGEGAYGRWDERVLRPSERVWLAGDYLDVGDAADPMPYGMQAALLSGGRAARAVVRTVLGAGRSAPQRSPASLGAHLAHWRDFGLKAAARLAQAATRRPLPMTCHPPPPASPFPYGDLVPLGFLLRALQQQRAAEHQFTARALQNYVVSRRDQKLWSFHARRLITATDSALVLLGVEGGAAREALGALEAFRDARGGYAPQLWSSTKRPYHMLRIFDNEHWCQADYGATCIIYALRRAGGLPTGNTFNYLRANFERRSALFFANPYLLDWVLALALAQAPDADDLKQQLCREIVATANEDDTFGRYDVPFSSALAILCLATLGVEGALLQRARLRLLDFQQRDGLWPVAVPFYSTRRLKAAPRDRRQILRICGQEHALYTYHDTQRMIGTAVALLALAASEAAAPAAAGRVQDKGTPGAAHPRYGAQDHAAYIAEYALPPYLSSPVPDAIRQESGGSLTEFDITVRVVGGRVKV